MTAPAKLQRVQAVEVFPNSSNAWKGTVELDTENNRIRPIDDAKTTDLHRILYTAAQFGPVIKEGAWLVFSPQGFTTFTHSFATVATYEKYTR